MGARKLYEAQILELIKNIPEEELEGVVSMIEKIKQQKTEKFIEAIEQGKGRFKNILSSSEQFIERKQKEKLLDR
ncbi:MAG: hypothetical protein LH478_14730 [Chitinophagaceae bacterium]|nr:hypothetical protein [Chitinophagaceae bacterium]